MVFQVAERELSRVSKKTLPIVLTDSDELE